jgi:hypothetical protein
MKTIKAQTIEKVNKRDTVVFLFSGQNYVATMFTGPERISETL